MKYWFIAGLILFVGLLNLAKAETRPVIDIQPVGEQVRFSAEIRFHSKAFASYAPDKHIVYVRLGQQILTIDVTDGSWSEEGAVHNGPSFFGYSLYHGSLLFWHGSVSDVYQYLGNSEIIRIDSSYYERNQFDNSPWIDPADGSIYAFGGYGFFQFKNFITRFDHDSRDWRLVEPADLYHHPIPIVGADIYTDSRVEKIFMLGYADFFGDVYASSPSQINSQQPGSRALRQFIPEERRWYRRNIISIPERHTYHGAHIQQKSVHPGGKFFLNLLSMGERVRFSVYDIEANRFYPLDGISQHEIFVGLRGGYIFWSERDEAFYALILQYAGGQQRYLFQLYRIDIPDEEALLTYLAERYPLENAESPSWPVASTFITVLLLFAGLLYLALSIRASRRKKLSKIDKSDHPPKIVLIHTADDKVIAQFGRKRMDEFQDSDRIMLIMLADRLQEADKYLTSDEMDAALWPDYPNPDYIRRMRNMTLARIERILGEISGIKPDDGAEGSEHFIVRRPSPTDKRRYEYRLNEQFIALPEQT